MNQQVLYWFRQDLRLTDNPALSAAANAGNVLAIYILDDENAQQDKMGAASRWWLYQSLSALHKSLDGHLNVYCGAADEIIPKLLKQHNITHIYWNRCYEPWRIQRDKALKQRLGEMGRQVHSYNGSLLWEPWQVKKDDGTPYRVFTPFYRKGCLTRAEPPRKPLGKPQSLALIKDPKACALDDLDLLPKISWYSSMQEHWPIGEQAAQERLQSFVNEGIGDYKEGRNFPNKNNVSRLSPYLHWGEMSINRVWYEVSQLGDSDDIQHFLSELGWREFSYHLLYHFPKLAEQNLNKKFDHFPWQNNQQRLQAWQRGQTGYPIVDAGMRELWQTGYMHNRLRMIVGSFLVKNLLLHWRHGYQWFWDCLLDADHANNSASWQWIAGCGADAAPYFRIFNPITQSNKFAPDGEYIRQYVPEIAKLPNKHLAAPWLAPEELLKSANIQLGKTYPMPIVDLKLSRERALNAFKGLKEND